MRPKFQSPIHLKIILPCFTFCILILLSITRTTTFFSPSKQNLIISSPNNENQQHPESKSACPSILSNQPCTKAPPSLTNAILHYATTNVTPQQTLPEVSVTKTVLDRKSPCNFLVFGLGHDSLMWAALNHRGRTVFLDEDESWVHEIRKKFPDLESYHVEYTTKVKDADKLMEIGKKTEECQKVTDPRVSKCELALKGLPREVYEADWDLIMVDAPTGYHDEAPGRMGAIYTAGLMARNRGEEGETDVFVHDVDRVVEDKFSLGFLCQGYLKEQHGRLRHFTIPSRRGRTAAPFCPEKPKSGTP